LAISIEDRKSQNGGRFQSSGVWPMRKTMLAIQLACALVCAEQAVAADGASSGFDTRSVCAPTSYLVADGKVPSLDYVATTNEAELCEGWVQLMISVRADGTVNDVATLDYVGTAALRDSALRAVRQYRFKMDKAKAAPQYGEVIEISVARDASGASHPAFVKLYEEAKAKIAQKDYAAARTLLERTRSGPQDNYEQTRAAFALALIANETGDWRRALSEIRHATIDQGKHLDKATAKIALGLRVQLEAKDGRLRDAVCTYEWLKALDPKVNDDVVALARDIVAAYGGPAPVSVKGVIYREPTSSHPAMWMHPMVRRTFAFEGVTPAVKTFRLVCTRTVLEEKVSEEMEWSAPPDAGKCQLFVFGSPGATFKLLELP
jgi:hypothetical protein